MKPSGGSKSTEDREGLTLFSAGMRQMGNSEGFGPDHRC